MQDACKCIPTIRQATCFPDAFEAIFLHGSFHANLFTVICIADSFCKMFRAAAAVAGGAAVAYAASRPKPSTLAFAPAPAGAAPGPFGNPAHDWTYYQKCMVGGILACGLTHAGECTWQGFNESACKYLI